MAEKTGYSSHYQPDDPAADEIRLLDWKRDPEQAVKDTGALIAEAMEDEFVDPIKEAEAEDWLNLDTRAEPDQMDGFRHAMAHDGIAASYEAGERLQELLGNVPEEHRTETLDHLSSTYAPPAGRIDRELALAYRRERIILEGLNWPEPDPVQEKALLDAVGEATYREITAGRELLREATYLCATPNEYGPKNNLYFLNNTSVAYRKTLSDGSTPPEQVQDNALDALELAYRRLDFLANLHLNQETRQLNDTSTTERILEIRTMLDANPDISSSERLVATLGLTAETLRQTNNGGAAAENLERMAMLARNCDTIRRDNPATYRRTAYESLSTTEMTERNAYETIRELRAMGYQDETQAVKQLGSKNWNEAMAATAPHGTDAERAIGMLGKLPEADWAAGRWKLMEAVGERESAAELRDTGHHELSEKLERLMQDSQACNAVRLAAEPREVIRKREMPWHRHSRYDTAVGNVPTIITERELLSENIATPQTNYDPVAHEVNRMGYRLLSEIQENMHFQQAQASELTKTAREHGLSEAVVERLAQYATTVKDEQIAQHGLTPTKESVQSTSYGAAVTLALDNAVKQENEDAIQQLLYRLETSPYLAYAIAMSSVDPIIRDGIQAASDTAAHWNDAEIADGAVGFPVNYAELEWQNTDGGRREWIVETGQEGQRTWLAGDCTVRALAEATGDQEHYGEIWQEITDAKQVTQNTTDDIDTRGADFNVLEKIYQQHGMQLVYTDKATPINEAKLEIDLREVPTALQHLFDDQEKQLTYIAGIGNHAVAVRGNQLMDVYDSRQSGEKWYSYPSSDDGFRNKWGKLHYLWVLCEEEKTTEIEQTFERYAKQRRHDAT